MNLTLVSQKLILDFEKKFQNFVDRAQTRPLNGLCATRLGLALDFYDNYLIGEKMLMLQRASG